MADITIRRYQADLARSHNDFVVLGRDAKDLDRHLRDSLRLAEAERGKGVWSQEDPEVWIGGRCVGRLERGGDIADLARRAMRDADTMPPPAQPATAPPEASARAPTRGRTVAGEKARE